MHAAVQDLSGTLEADAEIQVDLSMKPVKIGQCAAGRPFDEVQANNAARIADKSEVEIRALVNGLHQGRVELVESISVLQRLGDKVGPD